MKMHSEPIKYTKTHARQIQVILSREGKSILILEYFLDSDIEHLSLINQSPCFSIVNKTPCVFGLPERIKRKKKTPANISMYIYAFIFSSPTFVTPRHEQHTAG